ncbi:MAG TPA: hypothetical protein VK745_18150 [Polyangiaceae bacterium]|nr:hypothetical protein [Polyangiaceae bacterium]
MSLSMLTRVALLTTIIARGVAPAIPGLTVGIAPFIALSTRIAAFLSQLVAAGGVAAAVILATRALRLPKLDLGFRLIALPASAIVIALVMAAWARPLEPELCRMMALAAIAASLASAVASLRSRDTRASGLVLGSASLSGLSHLIARELVSRAAERLDSSSLRWAVAVATLATLLDLLALGLALAYVGQMQRRKSALGAALVLLPALAIGLFAAHGTAPGAGLLRVLVERVLAQLSRAPAAALPPAARFAVTTALLIGAGLCVAKLSDRRKTSVVLGLCLLSLGAPDIPLPALWLVVAALLAPKQADALPAKEPETRSDAPPATG